MGGRKKEKKIRKQRREKRKEKRKGKNNVKDDCERNESERERKSRRRAVNKRSKEDRMTTDIKLESIRRPSTDCLNHVGWYASFSKGGCTPGTKGVSTNVASDMTTEETEEPRPSGDRTVFLKPQLGMKREKTIAKT